MPIVTAGRDFLVQRGVLGTGTATWHLGVGDSTAAHAAGQTDLQAATNKLRKAMDATYPSGAANVITFRATFGTGDANWVWNEWGTFTAASGGTMLTRKVEALGTKTNTQTWQFTATLTFTAT